MNPSALVFFPASALALGCATLISVRWWASVDDKPGSLMTRVSIWASRIPYTVVLLVIGAAFAVIMRLSASPNSMRSPFVASAEFWLALDPPDVLIYLFLPPLLYHGASGEWHYMSKARWRILGLAFPGVFFTTAMITLLVQIVPVFPSDTPVEVGILLGALLSATDPVAVVAVLRESGSSKSLRSVVDGESLLNDGSSLVLFVEALRTVSKRTSDNEWILDGTGDHSLRISDILWSVSHATLGGTLIGITVGIAVTVCLATLFGRAKERVARNERAILTVTLTLAATYCAFIVAQQTFDVSGAVAVVVLGLVMARQGAYFIEPFATAYMHSFWSTMDFLMNTIIFTYSGAASASILMEDAGPAHLRLIDWGFIPLLYVVLHAVRFGGVFTLNWTLNKVANDGMSVPEQIVVSMSGLRGSVSLILALMVVHRLNDPTGEVAPRIAIWTAGIVMMTLTINGTVIGDLCKGLGLTKKSEAQLEIARLLRQGVADGIVSLILKMRGSQRFLAAEWPEIQRFFALNGLVDPSAFDKKGISIEHKMSQDFGGSLRHSETMVIEHPDLGSKARMRRSSKGMRAMGDSNTSVDSMFFDAEDLQVSRQSSPRKNHKIPTFKIALRDGAIDTDDPGYLDCENRRRILLVIRRSLFEQFQNGMMSPGIIQRLEAEIMEALDNIEAPLALFSALDKYTTNRHWLLVLGQARYLARNRLLTRLLMTLNYSYVEESVSMWTAVWAALSAVRSRYWLKGACFDEVQTERVKIIQRLKEITGQHPEVTRVFDSRLAATVTLRGAQKAVEKLSAKGSATQAEADNLLRELEKLEGRLHSYFKFELDVNVEKVLKVESPLSELDPTAFAAVYRRGRHEVLSKGDLVLPASTSHSLGLSILIQGSVSAANRPIPNVVVQREDSPLLPAIQLSNDYNVVVFPRGSPLGALKALTETPSQTIFRVESPTAAVFHLDQNALVSCCKRFPELETYLLRWCAVQIVRHVAPRFSDLDLGDYGVLASDKRISSKENLHGDDKEATEKHVRQTSTLEEVAYKESRNFVGFLLRGLQAADIVHLAPNKLIDQPGSLDGVVFKGTVRTSSKSGAIINAPGIFSSPTSSIQAGPMGALLALCPPRDGPDDET